MAITPDARLERVEKLLHDLHTYIQRTRAKLAQHYPASSSVAQDEAFKTWLYEEIMIWRRRRDAEPANIDVYRFFDGRAEALESVLRQITELAGQPHRPMSPGYVSGRETSESGHAGNQDTVPNHSVRDPSRQTASMNLQDTQSEQRMR